MLKMIFKSTIVAIFMMLISPVWAGYQYYGAPLDSVKWLSSGNRLECRLSQTIPGYGKAVFRHHALEMMEFRISSNFTPRKPGQALLFVSPPNWKRFANRKVLGRVPVSAQKNAIVVPEDWAFRMALELREGMEAVWTHADWANGEDLVTAKVLPIRFESAWRDFQQCSENLINYGYKDVSSSTFYFSKKSMRLTSSERAKLDKLAEYVSIDTNVEHIKISSFTDSRGVRRINKAISKKRADMIKNYLVKQGVSPNRFVIIAQGEAGPKYDNRTKEGRAKNRRVEIQLVK